MVARPFGKGYPSRESWEGLSRNRPYNMGHKAEHLLASLKDWRRIATRYDCCASIFRSTMLLAAPVIFWL